MSTSEKNGSSFSRDEEERLDLSTRPEKTAKLQRKQWNFILLYYGNIWKKEKWMKTRSCYRRRSYAFVCINSARNSAVSTQFPKVLCVKQTQWSNDKTIIELGSRKISWIVSGEQINYLPKPRQIIDLLATDKSRYFAQPRPITVNCCRHIKMYTLMWISGPGSFMF